MVRIETRLHFQFVADWGRLAVVVCGLQANSGATFRGGRDSSGDGEAADADCFAGSITSVLA